MSLSGAFAIESGLPEKLAQWEAAYLSGWMVPAPADFRQSRPRRLLARSPFPLIPVGGRSFVYVLPAAAAT
jgi:hypothetical protein